MTVNVTFDWTLPQEVFGEDFKEDDLWTHVKQLVAISLFKEGKVSSGLAAQMLGVSRREFMRLLYDKGVPYFDLDAKELEREWESVDNLSNSLLSKREDLVCLN